MSRLRGRCFGYSCKAWFYASGCSGGGYPTDGPSTACGNFNSVVSCMENFITGPSGTVSCVPAGGQATGRDADAARHRMLCP